MALLAGVEQHLQRRAGLGDEQIRLEVGVYIGHRQRAAQGEDARRGDEAAVAAAHEGLRALARRALHHRVHLAVAGQLGQGEGQRELAGRREPRGSESPVAAAGVHGQVVGVAVHGHDVELAVGVDIAHRHRGRRRAGGEELGDEQGALLKNQLPIHVFLVVDTVVDQLTVKDGRNTRRPDVVVYVNGLPLAVIELKNAADESATIWTAFQQLQTYKQEIPLLFVYDGVLAISDGLDARGGTISADFERFAPWRTADGINLAPKGMPMLETQLRGMFDRQRLLDLIRNFVVFESDGETLIKKLATGMLEAATGSEASAQNFEALGVAVQNQDGTLRDSEQVLLDLADRFQAMPDGAEKAALAVDIFGKAGAEMIPFLNQGREGIGALKQEAAELGLQLSADTAAQTQRLAAVAQTMPRCVGSVVKSEPNTAQAILETSRMCDADLIVMGVARSYSRWERLLRRSVAANVADDAYRSVLLFPIAPPSPVAMRGP